MAQLQAHQQVAVRPAAVARDDRVLPAAGRAAPRLRLFGVAYERVYGDKVPCKCGKGTAQPYRMEHDTFPKRRSVERFPHLEIDCRFCDPDRKTWDIDDPRRGRPWPTSN